jgi:hypothetical protein
MHPEGCASFPSYEKPPPKRGQEGNYHEVLATIASA